MKGRDLDAARRSLSAFAATIGHPLTDWQARALDLATRITAIIAPLITTVTPNGLLRSECCVVASVVNVDLSARVERLDLNKNPAAAGF